MRNDVVHIVFYSMALVLAAAVQWTLPAWLGVKVPLVWALAFLVAATCRMSGALLFAFAAGGFCDALSALPGFCTSGFLLIVAVAIGFLRGTDREERLPRWRSRLRPWRGPSALETAAAFAPVAAAGELWTRAWIWRFDGGTLPAMALAAVLGFVAEFALFKAAGRLLRRCGASSAAWPREGAR